VASCTCPAPTNRCHDYRTASLTHVKAIASFECWACGMLSFLQQTNQPNHPVVKRALRHADNLLQLAFHWEGTCQHCSLSGEGSTASEQRERFSNVAGSRKFNSSKKLLLKQRKNSLLGATVCSVETLHLLVMGCHGMSGEYKRCILMAATSASG
jgi:hypothetical protein